MDKKFAILHAPDWGKKNYVPTFCIGRFYYIFMCFEYKHIASSVLRGLVIRDMHCQGKQVLPYTDIVPYIHHLTDKKSPGLGIKSTRAKSCIWIFLLDNSSKRTETNTN